ncbi:MAG TPA: permease [Phycisphaerae bacterium]|nr:permease [Phycisphaerae bacterium]HRY67635.1 permease [Phycisphaerae bacterium]HSA25022.1 permease [Phycisphaerae bacterium]
MTLDWRSEYKKFLWGVAVFATCFALPIEWPRFNKAVFESLALLKWYAREHVLLCLVPAFFIAGAIGVFVSQALVMRYLGPKAPKALAYGVASVSGTILAVCSCTVLPLFAGIWRLGAGLGPACAFLYSGPAINVLAIILTARILGLDIGVARAIGAISFSIIIGLIMHLIYRQEEATKAEAADMTPAPETGRPLWQTTLYFASMIGVLVFANWGKPDQTSGFWFVIWSSRRAITAGCAVALAASLAMWFKVKWWKLALVAAATLGAWALSESIVTPGLRAWLHAEHLPLRAMMAFAAACVGLSIVLGSRRDEAGEWFSQTWSFAKLITPLLLGGVLVAGLLLGRPGEEGMIPNQWVTDLVGGNSVRANLFASVFGAFMYFATLTEAPILQGLIGSGMGKGPALALLLSGPALSLPSMLVIRSVLGTGKTIRVQTLTGSVASLEPKTAVAWAGGKKNADGTWASTGCFKQAFIINEANLKAWLEKHPTATGRMVTVGQALAAKTKMTPAQIARACKIGECR